jgi:hypothetical protein
VALKLILSAIPAKVARASLLARGEASFTQTDQGIEIFVPPANRSDLDTILVLEIDEPAHEIKPAAFSAKLKQLRTAPRSTISAKSM